MQYRNTFNYFLSLFIIALFLMFVPTAYYMFAIFSVTIVAIKLAELLMTSTRKYVLYGKVNQKNKAILITGCDSGFGNALAKRMDSLGYRVYAGCLFPKGDGADDLRRNSSRNLRVIPIDVTDNQSVQDAENFISANLQDNVLWAVVNNAGVTHASEFDWTTIEELQRVYSVNTEGTVRVTKTFLPLIKKSKGRIVNNVSITGRFTSPGFIGYCMSKSAAVALTTGLRIELEKWGVKAISIEPGFYSTPLTDLKMLWSSVDKIWEKAPKQIKEDYGELYKNSFKESTSELLKRCNPNIGEVIDCFEDAITAKEPLSTYFPSSLKDKILIKILLHLDNRLTENYLRSNLERGVKPAALYKEKNR